MVKPDEIKKVIDRISLSNDNCQVRLLSFFSAVIADGEYEQTSAVINLLKDNNINKTAIYESILQSYLFLGFPRMIEAALAFNENYEDFSDIANLKKYSSVESDRWLEDGKKLCRIVYGKNYEFLKKRFLSVSPDLFRWMVIEGYGKVLSRSGLSQIERELAEVAALIVDERERQLVSHVLGSLNVGADINLIKQVNDDIRIISGDKAYQLAVNIIEKIESKDETKN